MEIKKLSSANINLWIALREQLWPHHPENANRSDGKNIILSDELASFIAVDEDGLGIGFADASIRNDYVNGCIHSPVAFLEGIFIVPPSRRGGVAKQLVDAVQAWGLEKGCHNWRLILHWTTFYHSKSMKLWDLRKLKESFTTAKSHFANLKRTH